MQARNIEACVSGTVTAVASASLSINIASVSAYLTDMSPSPSVGRSVCRSVCLKSVLWQNGWLHPDAMGIMSGVGRGMGVLDGGGDRRRGKGRFGMNLWRPIIPF